MSQVKQIAQYGQSIWIDTIQTSFIESGELQSLINDDGVVGLTSNPAIFEKAIAKTNEYDARLKSAGTQDPEAAFVAVAVDDIQAACAKLLPVYEQTNGLDGWVSLEVSPTLAHDTDNTVKEALALHAAIDRPNAMIKVPGTEAGISAFEQLTAAGISVNVTLLFSVERYAKIAAAYIRGLETRLAQGESIEHIASVASFFISRVDSKIDSALPEGHPLAGQLGIANAKVAYGHYQNLFNSPQWQRLAAAGARPQRLLWASTGTKNPALPQSYYVDALIGPDTVNTVPPATLDAYRSEGQPANRLENGLADAHDMLAALSSLDIDLSEVTNTLESEGVAQFETAYANLIQAVKDKLGAL